MTGMEYLLEHLEDRKLFYRPVPDEAAREDTNSQVKLARGRPDRNQQFLLDLGITRRICIHESLGKPPCQIVARDNVMMGQASHQDHQEPTTWERITDTI
jgi:hypothetical protein